MLCKAPGERAVGRNPGAVGETRGEEGREEDPVKGLPCCEGISLEAKVMQAAVGGLARVRVIETAPRVSAWEEL